MSSIMEPFADVLPGLTGRYKPLRRAANLLSQRILENLEPQVLRRAADMLGKLVHGKIMADTELDADLISDFALYGIFQSGENEVQRYRRTHRQSDPERQRILDAMAGAIFTLVRVVDTCAPESAFVAEDILLDNQRMLIADRSISATAPVGLVLCTRLFHLDGFWMTTGLGFSLFVDNGNPAFAEFCARTDARTLRNSPELHEQLHGDFAASIVKTFMPDSKDLQAHSPSSMEEPESQAVETLISERVERNAPCPCGSGKKYKKCCGR